MPFLRFGQIADLPASRVGHQAIDVLSIPVRCRGCLERYYVWIPQAFEIRRPRNFVIGKIEPGEQALKFIARAPIIALHLRLALNESRMVLHLKDSALDCRTKT